MRLLTDTPPQGGCGRKARKLGVTEQMVIVSQSVVSTLAPAARHLYAESTQVSAKTSATMASPVHTEPGAGCNRLRDKNCYASTLRILKNIFILSASPIIDVLFSNSLRFPNKIFVANEAAQMTFSFQPKRI